VKLLPTEKLALEVMGWGLLAVLSFFFHAVGFAVIFLLAANKVLMFMFVYSNTKDFPYDTTNRYEQLTIPGVDASIASAASELGAEREGSL
jgi:hypothetical protein